MIASIVESDFYTQMRTNQQLGYIVWSFSQRIEDRIFFRLVIQSSTHGPFELSKRVNAWLANTKKLFSKLTDQEFERHQQSLVVALEKEGDSIGAVVGDLYSLATDEKGDFRFKKKLILAVKDLKKEGVSILAAKIFRDDGTPRLEVLMRAKGSKEKVPAGVITEVSQFKHTRIHPTVEIEELLNFFDHCESEDIWMLSPHFAHHCLKTTLSSRRW